MDISYFLGSGMILIIHGITAQYSITTSSTYAVRNREYSLTCNIGLSSQVPSFAITWSRDNKIVAIVQTSNCQLSDPVEVEGLFQYYTYNCTNYRTYNLYISGTRINAEDGSVWKCGDNNDLSVTSSDYTLIVYDPPTADPVITGYSGTTTYQGNTVTLTCTLNGGNPLATLTWTCKGVNVQGTNANTQTSAVSRYTATIDSSYNGQRCTCKASHQLWSDNKVVHCQPFVVHYPPTTNPVISGYDGFFRYKDDKVAITCSVSGGSPPATLSWTCNGQQQAPVRQYTSGTAVTSDITVIMTKELNGKTCICQGRHSDTRYTPEIHSSQFIVYYPPRNLIVKVSPETPFPWIEGGNGKLLCSVIDGNPTVSYEWSTSDRLISGQTTNILSLSSLTKDHNRKGYKCKVTNAYTTAKNLNLVSQLKELDVEYNPVVSVGKNPAYVRETDTFERICAADGNPPPTNTWTRSHTDGDTLRLVNIMRNQTGEYTCRAQAQSKGAHGFLTGKAVLEIIVQYPPTVQAILDKTSIPEGQSVSMYCLARGLPDQYTYGGWVQIYKNTVIRSEIDFLLSQSKQNLTLSGVTHQDIGTYKCKAHNTVADKNGILYQHGTSDLNIKFSAVFNSSKKFNTELNQTVDIKIPFFANPALQNVDEIALTKQNINQKQRSDIQLRIEKTNLDILFHGKTINVEGQEIIIRMLQFNSKLQGNYTVEVKNYNGGSVSSFVFEVVPSGPPEHPKKFHILRSTAHSIVVTWIAGDNGGHQQTFVISYQQTRKIDTLKTRNITETVKKQNYTQIISNLSSETEYSFWIYAYNSKGSTKRNIGSIIPNVIKTQKLVSIGSNTDGTVIGIVVAISIVLIVAVGVIVFVLIRRRSLQKEKKKDGESVNRNTNSLLNNGNGEDEDGMRINKLYESSGPNYKKAGTAGGGAYSKVDKNKGSKSGVDNQAAIYSHVDKKKPPVDPSAVYAEVNKCNKNQKDGKKETTPKAPKVSNTNNETGMVYENVKSIEKDNSENANIYESVNDVHGILLGAIPPKMQSKPKKYGKKNKGDLNYADLELVLPTQKGNKKAEIHGIENKTNYAEVDFSRRAEPLGPEKKTE